MADLSDTIEQAAQQPKVIEVDGVRVTMHPLPDQIEADQYLARKASVESPHYRLRLVRFVLPGAV